MPPFRFFRHATILRVFGLLMVAVLALEGTRDLARRRDASQVPRIWRGLFVLLPCALAALALYGVRSGLDPLAPDPHAVAAGGGIPVPHDLLAPSLAWLQLITTWCGAALALVALATARTRVGKSSAILGLLVVAGVDAVATARVATPLQVTVGDASTPFLGVVQDHTEGFDLTATGLERVFALDVFPEPLLSFNEHLARKQAAFDCYFALWSASYGLFADRPRLRALATGSERLWFAEEAAFVTPDLQHTLRFALHVEATDSLPMLVHAREALTSNDVQEQAQEGGSFEEAVLDLPRATPMGAEVQRYTARELAFEVECPADGWLVVTDRWAPGWQATVDGKEVEVSGAWFLFRALPVHAGRNAVRFRYEPAGLGWLVFGSWTTLALVACGAIVAGLRARQGRSSPAERPEGV